MPTRDPAHTETQYLHAVADFTNKNILEIGTGNGRLTWRYADLCQSVVAVDINHTALVEAQASCPPKFCSKISFVHSQAQQLPLAAHRFEGAILAWSL